MTRDDLVNLSFTDLRALLKTRRDELNALTDLNFDDVYRYLLDLPVETHTPDSIEALEICGRTAFYSNGFISRRRRT